MIGVEPVGANAMRRSLDAGAPTTIESSSSIADGLLPVRPGDLTFAHAREFVDDVITVTDEAIADATCAHHAVAPFALRAGDRRRAPLRRMR